MTPEGRIKAAIDKILNNTNVSLWYFKPIQHGYGKRALDYICCINGRFVGIEVKRPGEEPTAFQRITSYDMHNAGGMVWWISDMSGVDAFRRWMEKQPKAEAKGASW